MVRKEPHVHEPKGDKPVHAGLPESRVRALFHSQRIPARGTTYRTRMLVFLVIALILWLQILLLLGGIL
jgi:hypothetical protein